MEQQIIQTEKEAQQIKLIWSLHFIWNIVSWWILWTILVAVYMFMSKDLQPKSKKVIYNIINFNVSFYIYMTVSFVLIIILIGIPMLIIGAFIWFIGLILWFIKHLAWDDFHYPLAIPFLK